MDSTNAPRYPKKDSTGTPRTRGSMVDRATMDEPMNKPATMMPSDSLLMIIERLRMGASEPQDLHVHLNLPTREHVQRLTCILRRIQRARACGAQRQRQLLHGAYHLSLHILRALDMRVDDGHHVLVGNERHDGALKGDDAA